jgi:hypothetical protein
MAEMASQERPSLPFQRFLANESSGPLNSTSAEAYRSGVFCLINRLSPNPRLQRTRFRSPLSRKPFGGLRSNSLLALALCATGLYGPGSSAGPAANTVPPKAPARLTRPFPDPNSVEPPEILRNEGARCPVHRECFVEVDTPIRYGLPGGHLSSLALAPVWDLWQREYDTARRYLFPYACHEFSGGCVVMPDDPKTKKQWCCPVCAQSKDWYSSVNRAPFP